MNNSVERLVFDKVKRTIGTAQLYGIDVRIVKLCSQIAVAKQNPAQIMPLELFELHPSSMLFPAGSKGSVGFLADRHSFFSSL
jgi:hypothetical protein